MYGLTDLRTGRVSRCNNAGDIEVNKPRNAVRSGMGYLGEERSSMGLFSGQSILTNMMVPGKSATTSFTLLNRMAERGSGRNLIDQLSIRCNGLDQAIEQLSGGNQQKALIARWLHCGSQILLLDEPTRGVDVGTKRTIYDLLLNLRDDGKTIIVASSDIEELMTICDRTLVLSDRKLVREFQRGGWTENDILAAAFQEFTGQSTIRRNLDETPQQMSDQP